MHKLKFILFFVFLLLISTASAYDLKENYIVNDDTQMYIHSTQWSAQTFNTSDSYDIKIVGIKLYEPTDSMINVSLYPVNGTGAPNITGGDLISAEINGSTLGATPGAFVNFTFDSAYTIVAGTTYAIVAYVDCIGMNGIDWRLDQTGSSYTGGLRYVSTTAGVNWTGDSGDDMMFETYTLTPSDVRYVPTNPSFEIGSPFSWAGTGGVADRSNTIYNSGNYSLKITQTGGANTLAYQNLTDVATNLINGTNYTASSWIYVYATDTVGHDMHGELAMGSSIDTQGERRTYGSVNTSNTTDTWTQNNLTFLYDNSTDLIFGLFGHGYNGSGAGGIVYWDDAYIYNYTTTAASDTCTCAGLNTNWEIALGDICNMTSSCDIGTGELSFTGTGTFSCNETLTISDMGSLAVDQNIIVQDNCNIIIG